MNNRNHEISLLHRSYRKKKKKKITSHYTLSRSSNVSSRLAGNDDATNCLVSVCSRLARFGRLGRTWDKTRVFGSGSIDKPSGSTLSGLTLRHLNSSAYLPRFEITATYERGLAWREGEGWYRKERSSRHRQTPYFVYCYPAIYSNGGAKQRKTSMITVFLGQG